MSIVWKLYDRNQGKLRKMSQPEGNSEEQRQLIQDIDRKVYYRFSINQDGPNKIKSTT